MTSLQIFKDKNTQRQLYYNSKYVAKLISKISNQSVPYNRLILGLLITDRHRFK